MVLFGHITVINNVDDLQYTLRKNTCYIGRDYECEVQLQIPIAPKYLCKVHFDHQLKEAVLTNLNQEIPVRVNGSTFNHSTKLENGDLVTIIDSSFRFEYLRDSPNERKPRRPSEAKNEEVIPTRSRSTSVLGPGTDQVSFRNIPTKHTKENIITPEKSREWASAADNMWEPLTWETKEPKESATNIAEKATPAHLASEGSGGDLSLPSTPRLPGKGEQNLDGFSPFSDIFGLVEDDVNPQSQQLGDLGPSSQVTGDDWEWETQLFHSPHSETLWDKDIECVMVSDCSDDNSSADEKDWEDRFWSSPSLIRWAEGEDPLVLLQEREERLADNSKRNTKGGGREDKRKRPAPGRALVETHNQPSLHTLWSQTKRPDMRFVGSDGHGRLPRRRREAGVDCKETGESVDSAKGSPKGRKSSGDSQLSNTKQASDSKQIWSDTEEELEAFSEMKVSPDSASFGPVSTDFTATPSTFLPKLSTEDDRETKFLSASDNEADEIIRSVSPDITEFDVSDFDDSLSTSSSEKQDVTENDQSCVKKKRVSFGAFLEPEIFDKNSPPNKPLKKGESPEAKKMSPGTSPPWTGPLKSIMKQVRPKPPEKEPSNNLVQGILHTKNLSQELLTTLSLKKMSAPCSNEVTVSQSPDKRVNSLDPHKIVGTPVLLRRSLSGRRSQYDTLQMMYAKRRSIASEASLMGLADMFGIPADTPNGSPNDSSECSSRDDFSAGRLTAKQLHGQSILGPRSRQLWVDGNKIVQTLKEVSEIRSDEIMKIPLRDVDVDHEILTPGSKKGKTCLPKDSVSTSYLSRIKTPPPDQKVTDMEEKFGNENTNKVTLAEQRPVITPATATHITSNLWANTFNIKGATPETLAEAYHEKENAVDIDLQNQKSKLSGHLGVTSSLKIRSNRVAPVTDRSAGQTPERSTQTEFCKVSLTSGIVFLNTQTALGSGPLNDPKERGGLKKVIRTPKGKTKISEDLLGSRVPMTTRTSVVAELKEDGESKAADSVGDDADFVQENLRTTPKEVHAEVPKKLLRTVEQQTPKWKCDSVEPLTAAVKNMMGTLEDKAKAGEERVAAAKQVVEPVKDRSKALLMELDQKHESVGYLPGIRRLITTPKGKEKPLIEDVEVSKKPVKTSRQKCDIEECPMSFRAFYEIPKMEPIGRKHGFLGKLRRKSGEVKNLTGMRVPREKPKLLENLTGVRRFFKTARVKPAEHLTSMEKMDMTSKEKESVEDLTVIRKLRSPKKTKGQSMEDLIGSKKLMKTPKPKDQSVNQRQKKICCRSYEEAENTSNISKIDGLCSVNVEDHIMMDQEVLSLPNERNKIRRILQECDELPNETKSIITEKEAEDFLLSFPDEKNAFVLNDDGQIMVSVRSKAKDKSVESLDGKIVMTSWEKNVKERIVPPKARSLSPWHKGERREPVKMRTRMFRDMANKVDVRVPLIPIKRDQAAKKTRASSALEHRNEDK